MSDRETILLHHPQAQAYAAPWDVFRRWKIYADSKTFVALSASHPTEAAAWADAAAQVRQRAMRQGQQQQGAS